MATYRHIDDIAGGDKYILIRTIASVPDNGVISDAWWTVKENTTTPDAQADMQIHITTSGTNNGAVLPGTTGARLNFIALPADTANLAGLTTYYYDIQVKTETSEIYTLEFGKLFPYNTVTQRTT